MPPFAARRPLLAAVLGGALSAAVVAVPGAPQEPLLRAVASYDGDVPALPGVRVLEDLEAVGALVVEATPAGLTRLAGAPGVRGVSPDTALVLTGAPAPSGGVLAADGLGGGAGRPGAGSGVRVAVIDTGVSDTAALTRASGRLVDGWSWDDAFDDGYGHGTFMASVVAGGPVDGSDGDAVGVAPGATVVVVRVADDEGSTSLSRVMAGLDWVATHADEVDVANLSFSHVRPGEAYGADPLVDAVARVRAAGVLAVVSAGNDRRVVGDPGFAPEALTVGAADLTGRRAAVADFSGSGVAAGVRKPDVVASGVSVLGVLPAGSAVARAHTAAHVTGDLWRGSGTSQAAAVTSGAAALHLAAHPDDTPLQAKAALRASTQQLPGQRDGAGLLLLDGDPRPAKGSGGRSGDPTGEAGFDANSWSANSWSANSWSANSWSANSWSANSWSAAWGDGR